MSEHDFSAFACPNPDCPAYGHKDQGNLRPHGWSSKKQGIRCLRCTTCGKSFSQRAGTPLFGIRLSQDKALAIAQHLAEGNGMRPTSRLTGVSLNTVLRFAHRVGDHAHEFHEQMVRHVQVNQVQVDEAWAFVGKKGQTL
jgi:transposase-like protein